MAEVKDENKQNVNTSETPNADNDEFLADAQETRAELIRKYTSLSVSERESTVRFKSILKDPVKQAHAGASSARWDYVSGGKDTVLNQGLSTECTITKNDDGLYHCQSKYLGNFDYDPDDWAIAYKEIPGTEAENADGSLTRLPVFKYVGDVKADTGHAAGLEEGFNVIPFLDGGPSGTNRTEQVTIPDGVKVLDYTFEGNKELQLVPGFPKSVRSAHCCFRNCTRLHGESHEFKKDEGFVSNGGGSWDLSNKFQDASGMFAGCKEFGDVSIGKLPKGLLTIDGMFMGCSQLNDEQLSWIEKHAMIGKRNVDADYSQCPHLLAPFNNPVDTKTSDAFKKSAERETAELKEFQHDIDWDKESKKEVEKHKDAVAGSLSEKRRSVLDSKVTVPDLNTVSMRELNRGSGIQSAAITVGTGLGIYAVTGLFTDSKLLRLGLAAGGAFLLYKSGVLPESFEPILQKAKGVMPESMHPFMDDLISKSHIDTKKDIAAVYDDQMNRYTPIALDKSLQSLDVAGGVSNEALRRSLQVNGKAVAENGVFLNVGQDGDKSAEPVGSMVKETLEHTDKAWETRLSEEGANKEQIHQDMREYYMGLMEGLEGYDAGANEGIKKAYLTDPKSMASAKEGLASVNREYSQAVMDSMLAQNEKENFLTQDDFKKLDGLKIDGVGKLSEYKSGGQFSGVSTKSAVEDVKADGTRATLTNRAMILDKLNSGEASASKLPAFDKNSGVSHTNYFKEINDKPVGDLVYRESDKATKKGSSFEDLMRRQQGNIQSNVDNKGLNEKSPFRSGDDFIV